MRRDVPKKTVPNKNNDCAPATFIQKHNNRLRALRHAHHEEEPGSMTASPQRQTPSTRGTA